ncbi:MAG: murein L,D-transpeptidase [Verrucomicrobia bacterium]|nr:MAG: murein L,D-transpeptidase [Verrucomicrobiota bacterium]
MRALLRLLLVIVLVTASAGPVSARRKKGHSPPPVVHKRSGAEIEAATKLQVFLDRANFSPGKLDGHYNDFTLKALTLYRQSCGEPVTPRPSKPDTPPDLNGIDMGSVSPVFIQYTVTEADLQNVGPLPNAVREKAKLKTLPYRDPGEEIAEKFHCDEKFLGELNPGKTGGALKPGDQVRVPNVERFELDAVKDLKPGSEIAPEVANDIPDEPEQKPNPNSEPEAAAKTNVKVDVKTNMLGVFDDDKIIAAYPVTVGSKQTATPIGEWKVRGVAKLPTFRYDERMLKHGERSKNFHILPPGPNNPVGVVWIALNKRGIGIHGTDDPNTIGQAVSHGCIRLANWDVVRLAGRVKAGAPVSVH